LGKYTYLFVTNSTIKVIKNQQLEHALNVPVAAMIAKFTLAVSKPLETGNGKSRSYLKAQP
jgi:hypothetical protein